MIGVSMTDIIKAYSNPAAVAARETFVLIPTMAEVCYMLELGSGLGLGLGLGLGPSYSSRLWKRYSWVRARSG